MLIKAPNPKSAEDRAALQIIDRAIDNLAQHIGELRGDPSRDQVYTRTAEARAALHEPAQTYP
jgi:hypothetical protein